MVVIVRAKHGGEREGRGGISGQRKQTETAWTKGVWDQYAGWEQETMRQEDSNDDHPVSNERTMKHFVSQGGYVVSPPKAKAQKITK